MFDKKMIKKTVSVTAHVEDVAFGGRSGIAKELISKLEATIYENMSLSDTEDDNTVSVSIDVFVQDNRDEWRDRRNFNETYEETRCETCKHFGRCDLFSFIRRNFSMDIGLGCTSWEEKLKGNNEQA